MFVIKNRDDYENLEKLKETKNKLIKERLEEKLSNHKFCHDMVKVSEPSIQQEDEITVPTTTGNEDLGKAIFQRIENYNQKTQ